MRRSVAFKAVGLTLAAVIASAAADARGASAGGTPEPQRQATTFTCTPQKYLVLFSPTGRKHTLRGQLVRFSAFAELYTPRPGNRSELYFLTDINAEGDSGLPNPPLCSGATEQQAVGVDRSSAHLTRRTGAVTLSCTFADRPTIQLWDKSNSAPSALTISLRKGRVVDITLALNGGSNGASSVRFDKESCTASKVRSDITCSPPPSRTTEPECT